MLKQERGSVISSLTTSSRRRNRPRSRPRPRNRISHLSLRLCVFARNRIRKLRHPGVPNAQRQPALTFRPLFLNNGLGSQWGLPDYTQEDEKLATRPAVLNETSTLPALDLLKIMQLS